jgi:hypothetical protein
LRAGRCGNDVVIADDRSCAIRFKGKPKPRAKGQRVATDWRPFLILTAKCCTMATSVTLRRIWCLAVLSLMFLGVSSLIVVLLHKVSSVTISAT